ncbi:hypothetical protein [Nitrosomonas sp.]|uniref:T4 family baseplate hub assembly chaperone n=1 Tax=Nitrosomonas sp. TaxID=42353 RepID=UPI0025DD8E66|nr:hypothetical protein [Nitrosomonas sp.]MBV6447355.1 hypothetical protein [Nitrosomonas sp.]
MKRETFTSADWLTAWEHSLTLPAALRPCALLAPLLEEGQSAAEKLSIGQRDTYLFDLYQALFGSELTAVVHCPACTEILELALTTSDLRLPAASLPLTMLALAEGTYRIQFRLPDSRDLLAISMCSDIEQAQSLLLKSCVHSVVQGDHELNTAELPQDVIIRLTQAMAEADPQAVTEIALICPACAHAWSETFDIAHFLLDTLGGWAERLFDQVHMLASTYGWNEADILAMSPSRRARYLARVHA